MYRDALTPLADLLRQVPIGPWPKDQKLKEIGRFMRLQGLYAVEAFLLAYLARVLGHSLEHTQMIIEGMKREICDPKLQLYNTHRFIYGRKPQNR